jgi:hypothetical protein
VEIVPYEPTHLDAVARFRQSISGSALSTNRDYIIWKYHENPFLRQAVSLATKNGELVGMRGLFGAQWELGSGGPRFDAPVMADTAVHPAHRESGRVFGELGRHMIDLLRRRRLSWYTNLSPTAANYIASKIHLGMRPIGTATLIRRGRMNTPTSTGLRRLVRSASGQSRLVARARAAWAMAARTTTSLGQMMLTLEGSSSRFHVSTKPEIADMVALAEATADDHIQHVTTDSYLSWRLENPLSTYTFVYTGEAAMDGYLVIQRHFGYRIARVADIRFASVNALNRLLEALKHEERWSSIETWIQPGSPELEEGFLDVGLRRVETTRRTRRAFLLGHLSADNDPTKWQIGERRIDDPNEWNIRMLASDGF